MIHTANIQQRDGAPLVLTEIIRRFPWLLHVFADGGYAGDRLKNALRRLGNGPSRSSRGPMQRKASRCCPGGGLVERTLAWLSRNRRLAKDFKQTIASATAWIFNASIQLFARRIAR